MRILTLFSVPVFFALAVLAFGTLSAGTAQAQEGEALSADQRKAVEGIIEDYLMDNPQLLVDALNKHRDQQQAEQQRQQRENLKANAQFLFEQDGDPSVGPEDASVTLVEFFDYQCGYCKRALKDVQALIENNDDLRVVFKEFPVLGPQSQTAAKYSLAVNALAPDKYFEFHSRLLSAKGRPGKQQMLDIASELGLDPDTVEERAQSDEFADIIKTNREKAQELGITGTPGFVVGETIVPGAVGEEQLQTLIDQARSDESAESEDNGDSDD